MNALLMRCYRLKRWWRRKRDRALSAEISRNIASNRKQRA